MTKNQQYQYKNEQQQQNEQYQKSCSSSSSTITRSRACTDEPVIKIQLEQLAPVYAEMFGGRGLPTVIGQFFARLLRAGMEPAVIASAIYSTGWARIPTPYYMRAILMRYMSEGIMTESQLDHDRLERDEEHYNLVAEREEYLYY